MSKIKRITILLLALCPLALAADPDIDGARLRQSIDSTEGLPDARLRIYLVNLMQAAGLMTHHDARGNLVGEHDGRRPLPPLLIEAPLAEPAAVLAAIEVAQSLHDNGSVLRHPLIIVAVRDRLDTHTLAPPGGNMALRLQVTPRGKITRNDSGDVEHTREEPAEGFIAAAGTLLHTLLEADRRAGTDQERMR